MQIFYARLSSLAKLELFMVHSWSFVWKDVDKQEFLQFSLRKIFDLPIHPYIFVVNTCMLEAYTMYRAYTENIIYTFHRFCSKSPYFLACEMPQEMDFDITGNAETFCFPCETKSFSMETNCFVQETVKANDLQINHITLCSFSLYSENSIFVYRRCRKCRLYTSCIYLYISL